MRRKADSRLERPVAGETMVSGSVGKRREDGVPGRFVWEELCVKEELVRMCSGGGAVMFRRGAGGSGP